jgi:MinD superfamily P-loop ATPase
MQLAQGVVINRSSDHDDIIENFCRDAGIPILAKIPYRREIAEKCARGELIDSIPEYRSMLQDLMDNIFEKL